jgi:predicted dehydrogenase
MKKMHHGSRPVTDRRHFLKTAAVLGAGLATGVHAAGPDEVRVGLIGCGGRGTGAAANCLDAGPGVKIVALGDAFKDRVESCQKMLAQKDEARATVPPERCFVGLDAYKQVITSGVDLVLLAAPGVFRPVHLQAALTAGKHVFAEKPVAVDAAGIRRVLAASALAKQKALSVVVGTHRRYQAGYQETIKRIHDGALGTITSAECWWNSGGIWSRAHQQGWTDVEWQLRNWVNIGWLSGDVIVEVLLHNLDVITWALRGHPLSVSGEGGRLQTTGPEFGNRFDHFAVQYQFPGGVTVKGECRWLANRPVKVAEEIRGTKGTSETMANKYVITGEQPWRFAKDNNPYLQEHVELLRSIRQCKPINDLPAAAESTLTAIMGRMAAYTGDTITWEQASNSTEDLLPAQLAFGPLQLAPVPTPKKRVD